MLTNIKLENSNFPSYLDMIPMLQLTRQQEEDLDVDRYVKGIKMSPQIMSYIKERLKSTNPELYGEVMRRLTNDETKNSHVT